MRKYLFIALLGLSQLTLAAAPAQDVDQVESNSAAQTNPESGQSDAGDGSDLVAAEITETNEAEEESSERFIPTEEISQDLGVSFPVDI